MLPIIIEEPQSENGLARYVIHEIDFQRNGVSGEGFYVVRFWYTEIENAYEGLSEHTEHKLIGVLFNDPSCTAIVDPADLQSHWRGDRFATALREAVVTHEGYNPWQ
jgi:hypothetical protein